VKLAAIAAAVPLCAACAAPVGDTSVSLHQVVRFADGSSYSLEKLEVSSVEVAGRTAGPATVPGDEVTIEVHVANAGSPIVARDVTMTFSYRSDGKEFPSQVLPSSNGIIARGQSGQITKTFQVKHVPQLFRAEHISVLLAVPSRPAIAFSGEVP